MENATLTASPQETQKPASLYAKLAKIMGSIGWVKKTGHNSFFNYDYAKEADILDAVREKLAEHSVMMTCSVESMEFKDTGKVTRGGEKIHLVFVRTKHTFFDGDSDKTLDVFGCGSGEDSGDKAIYKAITGAMKYVVTKNFLIPTGDDPEKDDDDQKPAQQQQAPRQEPARSFAPPLPPDPMDLVPDFRPAPQSRPQNAAPAPYQAPLGGNQCKDFVVDIQSKSGPKKDGSSYTRYSIQTQQNGFFTTFNAAFADLAMESKNLGEEVVITFKMNGRWKDMEDIRTTATHNRPALVPEYDNLPF